MSRLQPYSDKERHLVIGLMSGTSADGIDASLCEISGTSDTLRVRELGFSGIEYETPVREALLRLAKGSSGGTHEITQMSFLLGELFCSAAEEVCGKAGVDASEIDLIGSHGHTVFHIPNEESYLGHHVRGTMQIGDVSKLCEVFHCPVVSDFRVRDFAAGGMGAPLVPYTEYLLYRSESRTVALQNIGGIGNVTILPKACLPEEVIAFDTGPGNMVVDALVSHYTNGLKRYDEGGWMASNGRLNEALIDFFISDPYPYMQYPKTTGREYYGEGFVRRILEISEEQSIPVNDVIASATWFTAHAISAGLSLKGLSSPDILVVGGGGSHNRAMIRYLSSQLPDVQVMTEEDLGYSSDSKEAVAFAILANECAYGNANTLCGATGARHPVVLGKIQLEEGLSRAPSHL